MNPQVRILRAWYATVALGEIERLERKGWVRDRAEKGTATILAWASMANLLSLMFVLGWWPHSDRVVLWVGAFIVMLILERVHMTALRGWIREVDRPIATAALRARSSQLYIWLSYLFLALAVVYALDLL